MSQRDARCGFDDVDHYCAVAKDLLLRSVLAVDRYQFAGKASLLDRRSNGLNHAYRERLTNVIIRTALNSFDGRFYGCLSGHQYYFSLRAQGAAKCLQHFE